MAHIGTNEILAELRRLQDKATAYNIMRADLELLQEHLAALGVSYRQSASDPLAGENKIWYQGKAQAYTMAADKILEILA